MGRTQGSRNRTPEEIAAAKAAKSGGSTTPRSWSRTWSLAPMAVPENWREMPVHECAQDFPRIPPESNAYARIRADIQTHGLREPITVYGDALLDGVNRRQMCAELCIEPTFVRFEGDAAAAAAFCESRNAHRRHLTDAQLAVRELDRHTLRTQAGRPSAAE